jgi:hypothetical protein
MVFFYINNIECSNREQMLIKNSCNDLTTERMFKLIASLYLFTINSKLIILPKSTIECRGELLCTITMMTQETEQAAAYQALEDHREDIHSEQQQRAIQQNHDR